MSVYRKEDLNWIFEMAKQYNASSIELQECGTIKIRFEHRLDPVADCITVQLDIPEPFLPACCTISDQISEEDDTESD